MLSSPAFVLYGGDPDAYAVVAASTMEHLPCGVMVLSSSGIIEFFNSRLFDRFPIRCGELSIGMSIEDFIHLTGPRFGWSSDRQERVIASHYEWMQKSEATILHHYHDDGSVLGVSCQPRPEGGAILTFQDSSIPSREASEIRKLAYRDPLTGILNRRALEDRFEQIQDNYGPVTENALLLVDLDRFKSVNDAHGHATGDAVLAEVVLRIMGVLQTDDRLFRLGGDELVIWPQQARNGAAQAIGEQIVRACSEQMSIKGRKIQIGASVGIADIAPGDRLGDLLNKADIALYQAKHGGRGRVMSYVPSMTSKRRHQVRQPRLALDGPYADGSNL